MSGTVVRAVSRIYDVTLDPQDPTDNDQANAVDASMPQLYRCTPRAMLLKQLEMTESRSRPQRVRSVRRLSVMEPVVVGDRVRFTPDPNAETDPPAGVIEEVLPRTRALTRQAVTAGRQKVAQTLIANLDQVIAVFSVANPEPHLGMTDRFLVSCESAELPVALCFNKIDLGVDEPLAEDLAAYAQAGYRVFLVSAATGEGMDTFRAALRGKISAFVGPSGVGKSSLLNAVEPGLALRVGLVSDSTGKGIHTTRYARLVPLSFGGFVADTPGLRQLGLWHVSVDELDRFFPEFRPFVSQCKYANCAHIDDEGCAVREAVEQGLIDGRRYLSYAKLFQES